MSGAVQYDQFGNPVGAAQPGGDGEGIKALRKQYKEMKKRLAELETENATLKTSSRSGDVAGVLASQKLDPRVAKFYPADRPTTADAVAEWVDENRELFASQEPNTNPGNQTTLSAVELEGYEIIKKIQAAEAATEMDFKSRLDACQNEEEVMALLQQFEQMHAL
jgi:hypothetical protein